MRAHLISRNKLDTHEPYIGSSWLQHRTCIRIIAFQVSPQHGGRNEERNQSPVMWSVSAEPWRWTGGLIQEKRTQKTSNRPHTRGWANKVFVDHIPDTNWAEESENAPCSAVHELYWLLLMLCASSTARLLLVRARACVQQLYLQQHGNISMRKSDFPFWRFHFRIKRNIIIVIVLKIINCTGKKGVESILTQKLLVSY